ncbi:MAG: hypothetical protein PHY16_09310 [Methylobacter sp.]|nr:hypothetical protein [Methylobacter sp.]
MSEIQPVLPPSYPGIKLNKVKKNDNFSKKEQHKKQALEKPQEQDGELLHHIDEIV